MPREAPYYIVIDPKARIWSVVPSHVDREYAMEWPINRARKWGWFGGPRWWAEYKARWWMKHFTKRGPETPYIVDCSDEQLQREFDRLQKELARRRAV